jgi:hypothetical protein
MAYKVKKGDTPGQIAAKLGVSVDVIMAQEHAFSIPGNAGSLQVGAVIDLDGTGGDPGDPGPVNTTGAKESYTGEDDVRFHGIAGTPEIWYNSDTGESLLVYFVPGFDPPVPMTWRIESDEDLEAFFGPHAVVYDRVYTDAELTAIGALDEGIATEIDLTEGNPFEGWVDRYEREAKTRPYLLDPEVAALFAAAGLEGRPPSTAEIQGTAWFQEHSEAEQAWLLLDASNPKGAAQVRDANRRVVRQLLTSAGVFEPDQRVVDYIADRWTTGVWSETMARDQINAVADPFYDSPVDEGLVEFIDNPDDPITIDRNTDQEEFVRATARKWLGPSFGALNPDQVRDIAGRLRNDPNYQEEWIADLQKQRLAMFPEYEDPDRSYDEIAQPWRAVWFDIMGEDPDETASQFQGVVQGNDLFEGRAAIRQHGLDTRNATVEQAFAADAFRAFGGGARGLIR